MEKVLKLFLAMASAAIIMIAAYMLVVICCFVGGSIVLVAIAFVALTAVVYKIISVAEDYDIEQ